MGKEITKCVDCGKDFDIYGQGRCEECHRRKNKNDMAQSRRIRRLKELETANPELAKVGLRMCTKCLRKRKLTEFGHKGLGRALNKLCDRCIGIIKGKEKRAGKFSYESWRRRAYSCNTAKRARRLRELGRRIKLTELDYICKPQDLMELFNEQQGLCFYCGLDLTTVKEQQISVDHKTPMSREGTHAKSNLSITCRDCNFLKGPKTETEFRAFLPEYCSRVISSFKCRTEG